MSEKEIDYKERYEDLLMHLDYCETALRYEYELARDKKSRFVLERDLYEFLEESENAMGGRRAELARTKTHEAEIARDIAYNALEMVRTIRIHHRGLPTD